MLAQDRSGIRRRRAAIVALAIAGASARAPYADADEGTPHRISMPRAPHDPADDDPTMFKPPPDGAATSPLPPLVHAPPTRGPIADAPPIKAYKPDPYGDGPPTRPAHPTAAAASAGPRATARAKPLLGYKESPYGAPSTTKERDAGDPYETTRPIVGAAGHAAATDESGCAGLAARDRMRATLAFLGVAARSRVLVLDTPDGCATETIATMIGKEGELTLPLAQWAAGRVDPETAIARLATPLETPRVHWFALDGDEALTTASGSVDVVVLVEAMITRSPATLRDLRRVLERGGTLGIVQARAADGTPAWQSLGIGYVTETWVVERLRDFGFSVVASSPINADPSDRRDGSALKPWRRASGPDRMTLKLVAIDPQARGR